MATVGNPAGAAHLQFWRVDASNRMAGTEASPTSIANGTTTHAHYVRGFTDAEIQAGERQRVDFRGNDAIMGSLFFGANAPISGTITLTTEDSQVRNMSDGTLTDTTTNSLWVLWGLNDQKPSVNLLGCSVARQFQSRDSGTDGTTYWLNEIYLLRLDYQNAPASFQGEAEYTINVTGTPMTKLPNGVAFGTNQNFYSNKTSCIKLRTANPLAFTTFIADGSETDITLGYLPASSVVTNGATNNYMALNNTATALASASVSTGVAVLSAAGSAADFVSIMYETLFSAVP